MTINPGCGRGRYPRGKSSKPKEEPKDEETVEESSESEQEFIKSKRTRERRRTVVIDEDEDKDQIKDDQKRKSSRLSRGDLPAQQNIAKENQDISINHGVAVEENLSSLSPPDSKAVSLSELNQKKNIADQKRRLSVDDMEIQTSKKPKVEFSENMMALEKYLRRRLKQKNAYLLRLSPEVIEEPPNTPFKRFTYDEIFGALETAKFLTPFIPPHSTIVNEAKSVVKLSEKVDSNSITSSTITSTSSSPKSGLISRDESVSENLIEKTKEDVISQTDTLAPMKPELKDISSVPIVSGDSLAEISPPQTVSPTSPIYLVSVPVTKSLFKGMNPLYRDFNSREVAIRRLYRKVALHKTRAKNNIKDFNVDDLMTAYGFTSNATPRVQHDQYKFKDQDGVPIRVDRFIPSPPEEIPFQNSLAKTLIGHDSFRHSLTNLLKRRISKTSKQIVDPLIWRDFNVRPAMFQILDSINALGILKNSDISNDLGQRPNTIDYVPFHPNHLFQTNCMLEKYFWKGVDVSAFLDIPENTVIAVFGRRVIGCAFLDTQTDKKCAYIPYFCVDNGWRNCGIGKTLLCLVMRHLLNWTKPSDEMCLKIQEILAAEESNMKKEDFNNSEPEIQVSEIRVENVAIQTDLTGIKAVNNNEKSHEEKSTMSNVQNDIENEHKSNFTQKLQSSDSRQEDISAAESLLSLFEVSSGSHDDESSLKPNASVQNDTAIIGSKNTGSELFQSVEKIEELREQETFSASGISTTSTHIQTMEIVIDESCSSISESKISSQMESVVVSDQVFKDNNSNMKEPTIISKESVDPAVNNLEMESVVVSDQVCDDNDSNIKQTANILKDAVGPSVNNLEIESKFSDSSTKSNEEQLPTDICQSSSSNATNSSKLSSEVLSKDPGIDITSEFPVPSSFTPVIHKKSSIFEYTYDSSNPLHKKDMDLIPMLLVDVALHVSAVNSAAVTLLQKLGFKTEAYINGFFEPYLNEGNKVEPTEKEKTLARQNAMLMRLRR